MEIEISGIYQIQSKIKPYRLYIGSAVNIRKRWQIHLSNLKKNKHHSDKLQNHYNKYGGDDLVLSILEECSFSVLIVREQVYLDKYNPFFNISPTAGSALGVKRPFRPKSEEHKKNIGKSNKGKKRTPDVVEKYRTMNKGRKHTKEVREKMSKGRVGDKNSMFGRHHTKESNEKNRIKHLGKRNGWKLILNIETGVFYEGLRLAYESTPRDISLSGFAKDVLQHYGRYKNFIYV